MKILDFIPRYECLLDQDKWSLPYSSFFRKNEGSSSSSQKLRVRRVNPSEYARVSSIAARWMHDAYLLGKANPIQQDLFRYSEWINELFVIYFRRNEELEGREAYICETQNCSSPQGIMVIFKELCPTEKEDESKRELCFKVDLLATNPNNLMISNEPKITAIRGSGSLLLSFAEEIAKESGVSGVFLNSLSGVHNFYLNRGFKPCGEYLHKPVNRPSTPRFCPHWIYYFGKRSNAL